MATFYPFGLQNLKHLTPGTHVRALITHVHDRNPATLLFSIRIVNLAEFRMTDIIEMGQHQFFGCNVPPPQRMFGLGINRKIFRAILMQQPLIGSWSLGPCAYLIDVGITMLVLPDDPIFLLAPMIQTIPGTAIVCQYADIVHPILQPEKWRRLQAQIHEGAVVVLRVVRGFNTALHVRFANEPGCEGCAPPFILPMRLYRH